MEDLKNIIRNSKQNSYHLRGEKWKKYMKNYMRRYRESNPESKNRTNNTKFTKLESKCEYFLKFSNTPVTITFD